MNTLVSGKLTALNLFFSHRLHHWVIWEPSAWSDPHRKSESPSRCPGTGCQPLGAHPRMLPLPGSPGSWNALSQRAGPTPMVSPVSSLHLLEPHRPWLHPTCLHWDPRHFPLPQRSMGLSRPRGDTDAGRGGDRQPSDLQEFLEETKRTSKLFIVCCKHLLPKIVNKLNRLNNKVLFVFLLAGLPPIARFSLC